MKPRQFELSAVAAEAFNLAGEVGEDPIRVIMDRAREQEKIEQAREYERKMQRSLAECPGFCGCEASRSPDAEGHVVVDPAHVSEAWAWLKRRYHVCESLELSTDTGLVIKIRPRAQRKAGLRGPRRVSFGRPEQFEFGL